MRFASTLAARGADRLAALSLLRVVLAAGALAAPGAAGAPRHGVFAATVLYLVVAAAAELMRLRAHGAAARAAPELAAVDGLYAVGVVVATGGPAGPLGVAVFLAVAATALLVSANAGVGAALWCALLLALANAGSDLGAWKLPKPLGTTAVVVAGVSYVLLAIGVAAGARVRERTLRRGEERAAALAELAGALEHADHVETSVALAAHAREVLGFRRCAALVRDRDAWRVATGGAGRDQTFRADALLGLTATAALRSGESTLVHALEPGVLDDVMPSAANVVVVPIVSDDATFGIVAAEWGGAARAVIPAATVRALDAAATQAGRAMARRTRLETAARLATRDPVTGLANRRLFEETLPLEIARAIHEQTPLSLVLLDVDHFKQINDTVGHQMGDAVLRQVGAALVGLTKAHDLAARYGGDEFVVLLPGCAREEVLGVAERVRSSIAGAVDASEVTVSAGVATVPDDADDANGLVAAADDALYIAKRAGRDRAATPERWTLLNGG